MKKRILASLLIIAMLLVMLPVTVMADSADSWDGTADTSWYNDTDTEFVLTTAEQLAGLAKLVDDDTDGDNYFEGKTFKIGADIDLYHKAEDAEEPTSFNPIGDKNSYFKGTFDGQGHTIMNMYQNGWALGHDWYNYGTIGLFGYLWNATVKNLTIENAECLVEGGCVAGIAGCAWGDCTFENITIKNSTYATYNNRAAGIVGYTGGEGTMTFKNVTVDEDTVIAALWGSYDCNLGGVVGSTQSPTKFHFEDVTVECKLDCYNDVTASYKWYSYRMCGMLIGRMTTLQEGSTDVDPRGVVTMKNVNITIGEWANQTYIWDDSLSKGCQRVEPGYSYGGVDVSKYPDAEVEFLGFSTIIGGPQSQYDGYYGSDITKLKELVDFEDQAAELEVKDHALEERSRIAKVGETYFPTLQAAIDAANGATVTLVADTNEDINIADYAHVVIDLGGNTLYGYIAPCDPDSLSISNGSIRNTDYKNSAIEVNAGELKLTDVNVNSARHAVRIDGAVTADIDGGTYKVFDNAPSTGKITQHAVNVSGAANVTIKDGTFIGPKGTTADSGSAVNAQMGSTVTIENGNFSGGKNDTLSANGTLTVKGGKYDQDPTAYVANGYIVKDISEDPYLYAVGVPNYTVKHLQQNLDDDEYTEYESETISGLAGKTTNAEAKTYKGFTAQGFDQKTIAGDGSTVVDIYYDRNNCTSTFKPENGEEETTSTVKYGAQVSAPAEPTKTGYTFEGWYYTDEAGTSRIWNFETDTVTGDVTLIAKWTANGNTPYTVYHWQQNINGGDEENGTNYTIANTDKLTGTTDVEITPALKSYDGFAAPGTQTVTIAADGNTVVDYYYTRNSYTVTYKVNGEVYEVKTFKYGEEVTVPEYEAEEGYTFSGWKTPDTMPAENIVLDASYGNVYTITWSNGDGGGYDKNYTYGETITLPESEYFDETMRKPDYFITGWVNEEGYEVGDSMPAMNLTFTAQYTKDLSEEIFTTVMLLQLSGDNSATMMPEKDVLGIGDALDLYQMQTMAPAARFVDVAASDWFHDSVISLANKGVVSGYPDGSFRPQGEVTWGEALKLVMKAVGYGDIDATNGHWASGYMETALANLLISGEVDLDAAITREEVANLTAQALKLAPVGIEYPFDDAAPEAAVALYAAGIINGSADNGQLLFRAESTITRAEISAIIWRVYCAR